MNWAEAIVLIVIVSAIARTLRTTIVLRGQSGRHIEMNSKGVPIHVRDQPPAPETEALRREVQDLRERIKVLERIATDGRASRELADEIEKLR